MFVKKQGFILVCAIFTLLIFLSPLLYAAQENYGGTLTVGVRLPQYQRLDARYMSLPSMNPAASAIYDGLFVPGPKGYSFPTPALAKGFETKDNKVWTISLRKGVKFHNGREMTAEDIKANFDWRIDTPAGWRPLPNTELLKGLKAVEVVDKYTVNIILDAPFAPLIDMLSYVVRGIAPPEEVEKWGKDFLMHPCGTGPFKIVEIKPNEQVVMERFDDYWGPKPYVDKVVWKFIRDNDARLIALQKGEVDMVDTINEASLSIAQKDPNIETTITSSAFICHKYFFNVRRWPMSDIRFRKAVWMGADWKNIVINTSPIKAALPARTPLQRTGYENPEALKLVPSYNPEEAKKLITAVEKDAGKKIPPIYLLDSNMSPNKDIAEVALLMLQQIGVPLNLQLFSHAMWWEKLLRDPKLEWDMGGFGSGWLASPWYGFSYFKSDSGTGADGKSVGGYTNPELDRLVDIMAVSTDEGERTKAIQEAEKILLKDVACIPLLNTHNVRAWNKKVKGHVITDSGKINVTTGWGANVWIEK